MIDRVLPYSEAMHHYNALQPYVVTVEPRFNDKRSVAVFPKLPGGHSEQYGLYYHPAFFYALEKVLKKFSSSYEQPDDYARDENSTVLRFFYPNLLRELGLKLPDKTKEDLTCVIVKFPDDPRVVRITREYQVDGFTKTFFICHKRAHRS